MSLGKSGRHHETTQKLSNPRIINFQDSYRVRKKDLLKVSSITVVIAGYGTMEKVYNTSNINTKRQKYLTYQTHLHIKKNKYLLV